MRPNPAHGGERSIAAATGNIYSGLWYPVGIAIMSLIIGFLFLPETKDVDIPRT
jgi:hypothetical protein